MGGCECACVWGGGREDVGVDSFLGLNNVCFILDLTLSVWSTACASSCLCLGRLQPLPHLLPTHCLSQCLMFNTLLTHTHSHRVCMIINLRCQAQLHCQHTTNKPPQHIAGPSFPHTMLDVQHTNTHCHTLTHTHTRMLTHTHTTNTPPQPHHLRV